MRWLILCCLLLPSVGAWAQDTLCVPKGMVACSQGVYPQSGAIGFSFDVKGPLALQYNVAVAADLDGLSSMQPAIIYGLPGAPFDFGVWIQTITDLGNNFYRISFKTRGVPLQNGPGFIGNGWPCYFYVSAVDLGGSIRWDWVIGSDEGATWLASGWSFGVDSGWGQVANKKQVFTFIPAGLRPFENPDGISD